MLNFGVFCNVRSTVGSTVGRTGGFTVCYILALFQGVAEIRTLATYGNWSPFENRPTVTVYRPGIAQLTRRPAVPAKCKQAEKKIFSGQTVEGEKESIKNY